MSLKTLKLYEKIISKKTLQTKYAYFTSNNVRICACSA